MSAAPAENPAPDPDTPIHASKDKGVPLEDGRSMCERPLHTHTHRTQPQALIYLPRPPPPPLIPNPRP